MLQKVEDAFVLVMGLLKLFIRRWAYYRALILPQVMETNSRSTMNTARIRLQKSSESQEYLNGSTTLNRSDLLQYWIWLKINFVLIWVDRFWMRVFNTWSDFSFNIDREVEDVADLRSHNRSWERKIKGRSSLARQWRWRSQEGLLVMFNWSEMVRNSDGNVKESTYSPRRSLMSINDSVLAINDQQQRRHRL